MKHLKFLLPLLAAMLTVPIVRCTKECDDNKHMRDTSDDKKIITVSQAKEFVESSCPSQPTTRSGVEDIPDGNGYYPFIPGEYIHPIGAMP